MPRPYFELVSFIISCKFEHYPGVLLDIGQIGIKKGWIIDYDNKRYFGPPSGRDYDKADIGEIASTKP